PYFLLEHPEKQGFPVDVPYRIFLPKGLEGILTIGLGMSVHRDALPLMRMQPDIQNHGYAMGLAAARAARENKTPRQVDVKALQKELVKMEIVPKRALTDT
ncbi:FAD-dependent oxidoreductase, partial [Arthrospira platensis SPKY1]|nr:FAD-dependent oxidoreductase [Arthrospira platensis SPKY1]